MAKIVVYDDQGRMRSTYQDPTGDPGVDDYNEGIPSNLGDLDDLVIMLRQEEGRDPATGEKVRG